ncbi:hypothetical protein OHB12_16375 [Nocardia sp. NBC_01730]|uniref:hypothetical protein n=1 Tax=Nocardia sp. NBC_01730 TaxID=2975998 RepID=UPI002E15130A|nr:hypothetical protein OHB12_29640 [Nocardia sp. NBC_01730]WSG62851.1 hypothetical protein OHB12_16375 [Nocardia sp. NBC_01730]
MPEAAPGPSIRLSACVGAVFDADVLVFVGCSRCVGVAPVADGVIGEHTGLAGNGCSYTGARVIDDLFNPGLATDEIGCGDR